MVPIVNGRKAQEEFGQPIMNAYSWPRRAARLTLLIYFLGIAHRVRAQQAEQRVPPVQPQTPVASPPASPANPPAAIHPSKDSGGTQNQLVPTTQSSQNDRILWAVPNYLTVENASSVPRLSVEKKFKLTAEEDLD